LFGSSLLFCAVLCCAARASARASSPCRRRARRLGQMIFMQWDTKMVAHVDTPEETTLIVRNSNVNEELGQVAYIFTDKTGTLTQNVMRFHSCSIAGTVYDEHSGQRQLKRNVLADLPEGDRIREFLLVMACCNTVVPNIKSTGVVYESQSPDEVALCEAARDNGVELLSRSTTGGVDLLVLRVFGTLRACMCVCVCTVWLTAAQPVDEDVRIEVLETLEFTSSRKRMSVLVRLPNGAHVLWSKGADDVMLTDLEDSAPGKPDSPIAVAELHLRTFSKQGLRTLVMASRHVADEEVQQWRGAYKTASVRVRGCGCGCVLVCAAVS
jgi:magnesium-transporting ATPase (P-type)